MNDWEFGVKRQFRVDSPKSGRWNVDIQGFPGVEIAGPGGSDASLRSDPGTLVLKT